MKGSDNEQREQEDAHWGKTVLVHLNKADRFVWPSGCGGEFLAYVLRSFRAGFQREASSRKDPLDPSPPSRKAGGIRGRGGAVNA
jgi:hypothetical protein